MIYTLTIAKIANTNYGQINKKEVAQLQSLCSTFTKSIVHNGTVQQKTKEQIKKTPISSKKQAILLII